MASVDFAVVVSSRSSLTKQAQSRENPNIAIISKELLHEYGYTQVWKADLSRHVLQTITEGAIAQGEEGSRESRSPEASSAGEEPVLSSRPFTFIHAEYP